jgi:hypothetical protein
MKKNSGQTVTFPHDKWRKRIIFLRLTEDTKTFYADKSVITQ